MYQIEFHFVLEIKPRVMKIKCLIVDDEPLARDLIADYICKLENFEIVAKCGNAIEAQKQLQSHSIDLMFLDINMPQISGIDFIKTMRKAPEIILTTAYREYALESYDLDVVDYLLKPVSFDRFFKAVNRYLESRGSNFQVKTDDQNKNRQGSLLVKECKMVKKVNLAEIMWIEGYSEYVKIHTLNGRIVTKLTLGELEENLPSQEFLRIHKSYIVALNAITAFSASVIQISDKELPIGRNYKNSVLKALNFNGKVNIT